MNYILKKRFFQLSFFVFFNMLLGFIPLSFIYGSFASFLTLFQASGNLFISINPILGLSAFFIKRFLYSSFSMTALLYSSPTLFSGFLLKGIKTVKRVRYQFLINVLLYLIFTSIFIYLRPSCFLYTLLWLPLLVMPFLKAIFFQKLSMHLYAHAVGSIIHAVTFLPLSATEYINLIPVAILERLILSAVSVIVLKIYLYIYNYFFLKRTLHA